MEVEQKSETKWCQVKECTCNAKRWIECNCFEDDAHFVYSSGYSTDNESSDSSFLK
jgi:hypothetical protein